MFIGTISVSTVQLTFKELALFKFWRSIEEDPQFSEKTIKTLFPFPTTRLHEAEFSSKASPKTRLQERMQQ